MLFPGELDIMQRVPQPGCPLVAAEEYTHWLATHHYENFKLVSWLLPKALHQHFYNVYAYCRWADDLGDEVADPLRALALLDWWERELDACYGNKPSHPVFVALRQTILAKGIPKQPFADLLKAFRQDQTTKRYADWNAVLGYCVYSANPVGRLVLYLCGYRDEQRQRLSDATCTALQLANFWQDVSRDLEKGRIYIPLDVARNRGLTGRSTARLRGLPGSRQRDARSRARNRPRRHRGQARLEQLRIAPQPRVAENQDCRRAGVYHRRFHRAAG